MFNEICVENFKGFSVLQKIPLKPITLLYGPNSAGKSSFLQALLLLKQTLEESNGKETVLLPKGNLVDLGSYAEFINAHDRKKDLRIIFSFKYFWNVEYPYMYYDSSMSDSMSLAFTFFEEKPGEIYIKTIDVFNEPNKKPVAVYKNVWLIPRLKRRIRAKAAMLKKEGETRSSIDAWITSLKRSVLVLYKMDLDHDFVQGQWQDTLIGYGKKPKKAGGIIDSKWQLENEIKSLKGDLKLSYLDEIDKDKIKKHISTLHLLDKSWSTNSYKNFLKIGKPESDALVSLSNCLPKELMKGNEGLFKSIQDFRFLGSFRKSAIYDYAIPSYLIIWASEQLSEYIRKIIYIGPSREFPQRVYSLSGNITSHVGKFGSYMPDILHRRPDVVKRVNYWLKKLDVGYEIGTEHLKHDLFTIVLKDVKTGNYVSPLDVGFGVSQILPIIVQGLISQDNIICIEQPELHIHPRLQAELGSFFAECADKYIFDEDNPYEEPGNQFIIETHSENLILRLQKLIRKGKLKKEHVSVVYFENTSSGIQVKELRLDDNGQFIDPWPHGFFEESFVEIFKD